MIKYTKAPLPFIGQKRNFIKQFTYLLNKHIPADGEGWTIIDAFGGSGLLAHNAKQIKPAARVIYNDFDGYLERLANIPATNELRRLLSALLINAPEKKKLDTDTRIKVIELLRNYPNFIDVPCLQAWLLFSGKQVKNLDEFCRNKLFNVMRRSDIPAAVGYLDGVEVVKQSYDQLLPQFKNQAKTLLVLDPPYLASTQEAYSKNHYFGIVEFVNLISMIQSSFMLFANVQSEAGSYIDSIIKRGIDNYKYLDGYSVERLRAIMNYSTSYEDCLFYKFESE